MSLDILLKAELRRQVATSDPYRNPLSVEFGFRARRFAHVRRLIERVLREKGRCSILDLGGTEVYWRVGADFLASHRGRVTITLVNLAEVEIEARNMFRQIRESATRPDLLGAERFDIVHSNSVIEHLGPWEEMTRFSENVRRLATRYYVQTPNFWMPYEPHFRCIGFQYLPRAVRMTLLRRFPIGYLPRARSRGEAAAVIDGHRLLSTREMAGLFPDARIAHEMFFGLRKSILAIREGA